LLIAYDTSFEISNVANRGTNFDKRA